MDTGILYGTDSAKKVMGNITVASWNDFKTYIDSNNVPAFVFWGNQGCDWCGKIEKVLESTQFIQYLAADGKNMAFYAKCGKIKGDNMSA